MLPRVETTSIDGPSGAYQITIAHPRETAPSSGFPIVYVLDANAVFATVVESVRLRSDRPNATGVVPAVVVGIGYPIDAAYDRERRRFDFTSGAPAVVEQNELHSRGAGGALPFRQFLRTHIIPLAERDAHVDPSRRTIVGHSLAGLFVLETLFAARDTFEGYVAASPSLWWDRDRLLHDASRFVSADRKRVMITAGEFEETIAPWQMRSTDIESMRRRRAERRMVGGAREFADALAISAGETTVVRFRELPGEDHASTLVASLGEALRFVLDIR